MNFHTVMYDIDSSLDRESTRLMTDRVGTENSDYKTIPDNERLVMSDIKTTNKFMKWFLLVLVGIFLTIITGMLLAVLYRSNNMEMGYRAFREIADLPTTDGDARRGGGNFIECLQCGTSKTCCEGASSDGWTKKSGCDVLLSDYSSYGCT